MSKLSPTVGGPLDKATAKKWLKNHKDKHPEPGAIVAHFFGSDIINKVLAQPGCVGIRVYYGTDDSGVKQLMLVGAKEDGNNIWDLNADTSKDSTPEGLIVDRSTPCPPNCPTN